MITKNIVLKVGRFPVVSESFIVEHASLIIELGYELTILCEEFDSQLLNEKFGLFQKYKLGEKTIQFGKAFPVFSASHLKQYVKAATKINAIKILTLLNPFTYGLESIKGRLLIDFVGYQRFKSVPIIHVQFGNYTRNLEIFKESLLMSSRVVVTFHGYDAHFNATNKEEKINAYKVLFENADLITSNTEYLKHQLIELGCPTEKIKVVHVPIDNQKFKPLPNKKNIQNRLELISVGRLIEWKGHRYGIEVVKALKDKGVNVRYRVIGEGDCVNELIELVKEHSLERNVEFLGRRSQEEVIQYMQESDIYLMTSVTGTDGRKETQGVVSGEAQACGLPVVGFYSGGVPFTIVEGKTGYLCEEGDVLAMTKYVEELYLNPKKKEEMSKAAVSYINATFSREVVSVQWRDIYEGLVGEE